MRLSFQYSIADYQEANTAHQQLLGRSANRFGGFALAGTAALMLFVWLWLYLLGRPAPADGERDRLVAILAPLLPPMFACIALLCFVYPAMRYRRPLKPAEVRGRSGPTPVAQKRGTPIVRWTILAIAATALIALEASGQVRGIRWLAGAMLRSPYLDVCYPFVPWVGVVVLFIVMARRAARWNVARMWEGQPELHHPHTIEATVHGCVVTTPTRRTELSWHAFPLWLETANLYLLYISDYQFHMVPKRAFASDEEREAFAHMLRNLIGKGPGGFPVLPAQS